MSTAIQYFESELDEDRMQKIAEEQLRREIDREEFSVDLTEEEEDAMCRCSQPSAVVGARLQLVKAEGVGPSISEPTPPTPPEEDDPPPAHAAPPPLGAVDGSEGAAELSAQATERIPKTLEERLQFLAELPPIDYEERRKGAAKLMGIRVTSLDAEVERIHAQRHQEASMPGIFQEPEPWPDVVSGEGLLDEFTEAFRQHLALAKGAAEALALWTVHTHCHDAAYISPLLGIVSPEKRCGKTTLLSILSALVRRPQPASNITPAAVFRVVESMQPTLLIDEADTFLKNDEQLRGILNSGHNRSTACVTRLVGDDHTPKSFSTWAPKSIALIGDLPATLADRSITIRMRRKGAGERVESVRADRMERFMGPRRRAIRWSKDNLAVLAASDPALPEGFNDRAADNWRPLLAIADAAGGKWPELARKTMALLNKEGADEGAGVGLLRDIRKLFDAIGKPYMLSSDIVQRLGALEERPWGEWNRGKPITARQVARLLGPYDISSKNYRVGDKCVHKGYARADFEDAFTRYIPDVAATPLQGPDIIECSASDIDVGATPVAPEKRKTPPKPCCSVVAEQERSCCCEGDPFFDHPRDELVPIDQG